MDIRRRFDDFLKSTFTVVEYEELCCNHRGTSGSHDGINDSEVRAEAQNVKEEPDEDDLQQMVDDNADMHQNEDPTGLVAPNQVQEAIHHNIAADASDNEAIISSEDDENDRSTARGINLELKASDPESTIQDSSVDKWMNPNERSVQLFGRKTEKCMKLESNGKELAYILEGDARLHYIDSEGFKRESVKLDMISYKQHADLTDSDSDSDSDRFDLIQDFRSVGRIVFLDEEILVYQKTSGRRDVYSICKKNLKPSLIFNEGFEAASAQHRNGHSTFGYQLVSLNLRWKEVAEVHEWEMKLIRVAMNHQSNNCSLMAHGDKSDGCFSKDFPAIEHKLNYKPVIDTFDSGGCKFKSDGSIIIVIIENKMIAFSIEKEITIKWIYDPWKLLPGFTFWNIFPKHVLIGDNYHNITVLNIEDKTEAKRIDLSPWLRGYRGPLFRDFDSTYTTAKYTLSLVYVGKGKDSAWSPASVVVPKPAARKSRAPVISGWIVPTSQKQNRETYGFLFMMLDLDTLECKAYNIGMQGIKTAKILATFSDGKLAAVMLDGELYFFNLTLSDPKEVFERRSKIRTNAKNFEEVCDGFCVTEYPDSFRAEGEYMTLKSGKLSKPLQTWLDLLKRGKIGGLPDQ